MIGARFGPYEIVEPLGAGGMGEVYRAKDLRLRRDVAIKIISGNFSNDPEKQQRLLQEARAASALNHPNILTIHDVGVENSNSYIVSELILGQSLRKQIEKGPFSVKKCLGIAVQIADGLAAAHQAGIVHRDLKPENIMISGDNRVKILDFGLAKLTKAEIGNSIDETRSRALTESGLIRGTVAYMSPEQASGKSIDFRSDQFSFGLMLFEMITGKRAFDRASMAQTLSAIIEEDTPAQSSNIPAPVRWLIERCLAKDPHQRYGATIDLYHELRTLRDHLSAATSTEILPKAPSRRLSLLWASLSVGFLVMAAALAGIFAGKSIWKSPPPAFHQLTFRRGGISSARFAPDGQTIFYAARWEGGPQQIYSTRPDSPESSLLAFQGYDVFSISASGKMLLLMQCGDAECLAEASLAGGAPRPLLTDVLSADWTPSGDNFAIIRNKETRNRIEFPKGKVLYNASPNVTLSYLRFSPKGDRLAFIETSFGENSVVLLDLAGHKTTLSKGWADAFGLAWTPLGKEIWFCGRKGGGNPVILRGVDMSGKERVVMDLPNVTIIQDIFKDGRVLIYNAVWRYHLMCLPPGATNERELSWFDFSFGKDLSADGRTLLFDEEGIASGATGSVYLRKTDGIGSAVRLGDGYAQSLSPDGKWAISVPNVPPKRLTLLPTGAGDTRTLESSGIECISAKWFPDGKRILVEGAESGHKTRLYLQNLDGGKPNAITPDGMSPGVISPDSRWVAAPAQQGGFALYPVDGGESRPLPGLTGEEELLRWNVSGDAIFVRTLGRFNAQIIRCDPSTGKKQLVKELTLSDPSGAGMIENILMTPDGKSYCYSYMRALANLSVIDGLK